MLIHLCEICLIIWYAKMEKMCKVRNTFLHMKANCSLLEIKCTSRKDKLRLLHSGDLQSLPMSNIWLTHKKSNFNIVCALKEIPQGAKDTKASILTIFSCCGNLLPLLSLWDAWLKINQMFHLTAGLAAQHNASFTWTALLPLASEL